MRPLAPRATSSSRRLRCGANTISTPHHCHAASRNAWHLRWYTSQSTSTRQSSRSHPLGRPPSRFAAGRRDHLGWSSGCVAMISIHELIHELHPTVASGAQWITCGAHRCPRNQARARKARNYGFRCFSGYEQWCSCATSATCRSRVEAGIAIVLLHLGVGFEPR